MLTKREKEIYDLMMEGYTRKEIADKLIIADCTVCTHFLHIFEKYLVSSRTELMALRIKELEDTIQRMRTT